MPRRGSRDNTVRLGTPPLAQVELWPLRPVHNWGASPCPRRARLLLMLTTTNFHWALGCSTVADVPLGPPSKAQYAAICRLAVAADILLEQNPGKLDNRDWAEELNQKVNYEGDVVLTARPLSLERILPGLPPDGLCASIPILTLLSDDTADCASDPSLVRLPEAQVEAATSKTEKASGLEAFTDHEARPSPLSPPPQIM